MVKPAQLSVPVRKYKVLDRLRKRPPRRPRGDSGGAAPLTPSTASFLPSASPPPELAGGSPLGRDEGGGGRIPPLPLKTRPLPQPPLCPLLSYHRCWRAARRLPPSSRRRRADQVLVAADPAPPGPSWPAPSRSAGGSMAGVARRAASPGLRVRRGLGTAADLVPPGPSWLAPRRSAGGTMASAARGAMSPDLRAPGLGARWLARLGGSLAPGCVSAARRAGLDPSRSVPVPAATAWSEGVHDTAVRLPHAAGASMPSSAVCLAATRAHVRFFSNSRSNLVAVGVILVIDGCWAKALPGVMPVPAAVMSLGFTFLPGGAAVDPLSQVPLCGISGETPFRSSYLVVAASVRRRFPW